LTVVFRVDFFLGGVVHVIKLILQGRAVLETRFERRGVAGCQVPFGKCLARSFSESL
jgi:hypothetical protein